MYLNVKVIEMVPNKKIIHNNNNRRKISPIISLVILAIPVIFCIFPHALGALACTTINRIRYVDEQIDIKPILELEIPSFMDVSNWTNLNALDRWISAYGSYGVSSNVQRFSTVEYATRALRYKIKYINNHAKLVGEFPYQYLVTPIEEARETFTDREVYELQPLFCPSKGFYRSAAIIQKGNVLIEVYSATADKYNSGREEEINRLTRELSEMIQEGDY